jgi:hypothetical protein
VLGATALPRNLVDTANLSILNAPVGKDGVVAEIVLRLGGVPPGDGEWDLRVFDLNPDTGGFALAALRSISVEPTAVAAKQHVQVIPPLAVREGQFVGICNPDGRIAVTYRPGWVLPPRATEVRNTPSYNTLHRRIVYTGWETRVRVRVWRVYGTTYSRSVEIR